MTYGQRVKIGQIGIGHNHGSETMQTVRRCSDHFEVVGVVEPDPVWRDKRAGLAAYQDLPWLSEEELLARDDVPAVMVETDVPDLCATSLRCLQAGKHVQMDKPTGKTYGEFAQVIKEARSRNLCVHMGYMFRNNPAIRFCINAVREGWLGEIFEIDAVMSRKDGPEYRKKDQGTDLLTASATVDLSLALIALHISTFFDFKQKKEKKAENRRSRFFK